MLRRPHVQPWRWARRWGSSHAVVFVLVLLLLNALLSLYRWLPGYDYALLATLIPESAVIVLTLYGLRFLGAAGRRRALGLLSVLVALLFLFGLGEAFYRFIFLEHFVPWTDLQFLPGFLAMITGSELFSHPWAVAVSLTAAVLLVSALFALMLLGLQQTMSRVSARAWIPLVLLLTAAGYLGGFELPLSGWLVRNSVPRSPEVVQTSTLSGAGAQSEAAGAEDAVDGPSLAGAADTPQAHMPQTTRAEDEAFFARLGTRDVHIFIVESYGHTLFSQERHYRLIQPVYAEIGSSLAESGYHVVSSFVRSPAFGGRSWLADATLLSGVWVPNQQAYGELFESEVTSLVSVMNDAGYETVLAAPGSTYLKESWTQRFPFDALYLQDDFPYAGREFSFGGGMTDQYVLDWMRRNVPAISGADPVFATYVLVSSHVPFHVLPPYIEDWSRIGDGSLYRRESPRIFDNNWLHGGEYPEGYTASIEYELRIIRDYIAQFAAEDGVFIVVGDHQPRIPIAEEDATYSVPIHVISKEPDVPRAFLQYGFTPGLEPGQSPPHRRMDEFFAMFLEAAGATQEVP